MTIHEVFQMVGIRLSKYDVYKIFYQYNKEFKTKLDGYLKKNRYKGTSSELIEYLENPPPSTCDDEERPTPQDLKSKDNQYIIDMVLTDYWCEFPDTINEQLEKFELVARVMPHDMDEDNDYIIGVVLSDEEESGFDIENLLATFDDVRTKLESWVENTKSDISPNVKLYKLQDQCACCG